MRTPAFLLALSSNPSLKLLPVVLLVICALFLSVLSGILAAFGNIYLLIALLALYGLFFILAVPVAWTVWIIFWAVFLIAGPSAYFIRFTQLQWLIVLVGAALLLPVMLNWFRNKTSFLSNVISGDLFLPIIFLLLVIFTTLINNPQLANFVNASRHYFLMWPLMLVFMYGLVNQEMQVKIWKAIMVVAVLQLPMALYQYFFVAKKSSRLSPWDAVIGTFPGDIAGGGESHGMAILLLIAMLTAIALWHGRKLHGMWMILVVVTGMCIMALAEVKAVVMLLPVAIALYYRKEIIKRPVEGVMVIIGGFLLVGCLFLVYEKLHYAEKDSRTHTFNTNKVYSTYDRVVRALNPEAEAQGGSQLGRITHIVNWWNININGGDIQHSLLGYGMGATHASKIGAGELTSRFPYSVNISSSIVLLWETGLLGHLIFLVILLYGAVTSERAAHNDNVPEIHRILLRIGAVGLLLFVITLPYRNFHFYSTPIQFLMMFMLGQAAYWSRFIRNDGLVRSN